MSLNFSSINDMQSSSIQGEHGVPDTFWNWLTGVSSQNQLAEADFLRQKEFFEQYQSMPALVQQYRDSGLNPNTLGGQTPSSPPSSPAPQVTSPLDVIKEVAGVAHGGVSLGQNERRLKNDIITSSTVRFLNRANAVKALEDAGLAHENAVAVAYDNYYSDANHISDLAIKSQTFKNMKKEWEFIDQQRAFIKKQCDWYDDMISAEIDLMKKQSLEAQKNAFLNEQRGKMQQMENDFFNNHHFHSDSPIDVSLRNVWEECSQSGDYTKYNDMLSSYLNFDFQNSFNQGLGSAVSSRFGKMSVWEVPVEIVHRIDDFAKDFNLYEKLDERSRKKIDDINSMLNDFSSILKSAFEFVQEDNIYTNGDGNEPLFKQ